MREHVNRILKELDRYGLKGHASVTNGNHIKIEWRIPNGEPRILISAKTPSCHRAVTNNVASIRRQCREDGINPTPQVRPDIPKDLLPARFFDPKPVYDLIANLTSQIDSLTSQLDELFQFVTSPVEVLKEAPVERKKRLKAVDLLEHMDFTEWSTVDRLAIKVNQPYQNVYAALHTLERKKLAENYPRVGWRRARGGLAPLTPLPVTPLPVEAPLVPQPAPALVITKKSQPRPSLQEQKAQAKAKHTRRNGVSAKSKAKAPVRSARRRSVATVESRV